VSKGKRRWWTFEGEYYWEDEGYSADDILALVRDRQRKEKRKLDRAHTLLAAEDAGWRGDAERAEELQRVRSDAEELVRELDEEWQRLRSDAEEWEHQRDDELPRLRSDEEEYRSELAALDAEFWQVSDPDVVAARVEDMARSFGAVDVLDASGEAPDGTWVVPYLQDDRPAVRFVFANRPLAERFRMELEKRVSELDARRTELIARVGEINESLKQCLGMAADMDSRADDLISRRADIDSRAADMTSRLQQAHARSDDMSSRLQRTSEQGSPSRGRGREPVPVEVRRAVYERDGGRCVQCGSGFDLQYDHILPVKLGGATTLDNVQILCADCNREKRDSV
jgi:DNA repair exonuclease SbcCD ATPase subunit